MILRQCGALGLVTVAVAAAIFWRIPVLPADDEVRAAASEDHATETTGGDSAAKAAESPESAVIRPTAKAFADAFNRGDAEAIAKL